MKQRNYISEFLIFILAAGIGHVIAYKLFHIPDQLEFVGILAILLFYPIFRRPVVGVYVVFILSPFIPYIRRLYYLAYERPSIDPLIALSDIFLFFILTSLFFEFRARKQEKYQHGITGYMRLILLYFVILLLRGIFFNYLPVSQALARFKYYGPPALFFLIGIMFSTMRNHMKNIWYITITIAVIASIYGIKQLYFGYSEAETIWFSSIQFTTLMIEGIPRPFSIFQAPVVLADYCQLGIIAIMMALQWSKNPRRYVLLLLFPVLFYAVMITSVRSSWIGVMMSLFLWFLFVKIKNTSWRIGILAGTACLAVGYQFFMDIFDSGFDIANIVSVLTHALPNKEYINLLITKRVTAIYDPFGEYSFLSRLVLWKDLLAYSREPVNAFLGRGVGALKADSLYFTYLAEFGYPGLIFIIVLLVNFIQKGFFLFSRSDDPFEKVLAYGVSIMNIVFAIVSITGTHIHYFPGDIYFWFWNGVVIHRALSMKSEIVSQESQLSFPAESSSIA